MGSESPTENEHMEQDGEDGHTFLPAKLAMFTKNFIKVDTSERPESVPCLVPNIKNTTD